MIICDSVSHLEFLQFFSVLFLSLTDLCFQSLIFGFQRVQITLLILNLKISRIFKTRGNNEWMLYCNHFEYCYFTIMFPNLSMCQEWSLILTSFFAVTITSRTLRILSTCFDVLLLRSSNLVLYQESISCRKMVLLIWSPGNVVTFCYKVCCCCFLFVFSNKLNSPQNVNKKINPYHPLSF